VSEKHVDVHGAGSVPDWGWGRAGPVAYSKRGALSSKYTSASEKC